MGGLDENLRSSKSGIPRRESCEVLFLYNVFDQMERTGSSKEDNIDLDQT